MGPGGAVWGKKPSTKNLVTLSMKGGPVAFDTAAQMLPKMLRSS